MRDRPAKPGRIWAVVPVKDLARAKQRLAPALTAPQRRALLCAMLRDVLSALTRSDCLAGVMLVTRDEAVMAIAEEHAVRIVREARNRGHTDAVNLGAATLVEEGVAGMLTIPADLPLATPEDIAALVAAHAGAARAVTVAPARDRRGSNALLCSPPDVLPFRFGDDSFYPHLERARALGIEPRVLERPALGLDIDTPDDLAAFVARRSATHAYDYLVRAGIAPAQPGVAVTAR